MTNQLMKMKINRKQKSQKTMSEVPPSTPNPADSTDYCHSCNTSNADFSKSQRKKKNPAERRCRSCVEKLSSEAPSPKRAMDPPQCEGGADGEASAVKRSAKVKNQEVPSTSMQKQDQTDHGNADAKGVKDEEDVKQEPNDDVEGSSQNEGGKQEPMGKEETESKNALQKSEPYDSGSDSEHEFNVMDESGNWSPLQPEGGEDEDKDLSDDVDDRAEASSNRLKRKRKAGGYRENVREKMARARESRMSAENSDADQSDEEKGVSLEQLKQDIMGRSIRSYNVEDEARAFTGNESKLVLDPSVFEDGVTVANHLSQDLTCLICHDKLYNPVSLMCGHSFCQFCLSWWIDQQESNKPDEDWEGEGEDAASDSEAFKTGGTCPTCRNPIPAKANGKPIIQVNTALKACMNALYGSEMNLRRKAEERMKRRATSGENGGSHQRGNEVLVPLPDEDESDLIRNEMKDETNGWVSTLATTSTSALQGSGSSYGRNRGAKISIRRNIVLDDIDQCRQLSLAFTKCAMLPATRPGTADAGVIVDVEVCILSMEEDEIDDSGFPTIITEGSDDEALISASSDRVHSCIETSAVIVSTSEADGKKKTSPFFGKPKNDSKVKEVALNRGMIGRDGSVRFRLDLNQILNDAKANGDAQLSFHLVKLKFHHMDTGAVMELRPPTKIELEAQLDESDDGNDVEFGGTKRKSKNDATRYFLGEGEMEEEDDHSVNEYRHDDFLVGDDHVSDEEEGDNEEDDECYICNQGGDLIVCDGGDHEGGCGHAFHINCINRTEVPPGDWICYDCAHEIGIDVGIEGHEWKEVDHGSIQSDDNSEMSHSNAAETFHVDDDSDDEVIQVQSKKRPSRQVLDVDDSDED